MFKSFTPSFESIRAEKWNVLTPREKLSVLQMVENIYAKKYGRPSRIVRSQKLSTEIDGKYDAKQPKYINVRDGIINSNSPYAGYEAVNVVLHEGYHAYQNDCVNGKISKENLPDLGTLEIWRKNLIVYEDDSSRNLPYAYYRFQPIEKSAYEFSEHQMRSLKEYFQSDHYYEVFIQGCEFNQKFFATAAQDEIGPDYLKIIEEKINKEYDAQHDRSISKKCDTEQKTHEDLDTLIERLHNSSPKTRPIREYNRPSDEER